MMKGFAFAAVVLALTPAPGGAGAARAGDCMTVTAGAARETGRFTPDGKELSFCIYARTGQTMKVTITPLTPDMPTQGHIVFPSGQQDGGPGGVIFNDKLSEEGRYDIYVGRRFEKKPGEFELLVELR